jgi:hypothetical protein
MSLKKRPCARDQAGAAGIEGVKNLNLKKPKAFTTEDTEGTKQGKNSPKDMRSNHQEASWFSSALCGERL